MIFSNIKSINKKYYWYSGIAAVFIYVSSIILGGMLYPGYSHISQDVSQLTSTNSPIRNIMSIFIVYNLLVSFFGLGLYKTSIGNSSKLASFFILTIGILGIIITWFPINTRGTDLTLTGVIHIMIVSIVSLLTIGSMFLFWFEFKKSNQGLFANISLTSGILFLVSGPVAAVNVLSPYAGFFERIPIGIFLVWILTSSLIMLKLLRNS